MDKRIIQVGCSDIDAKGIAYVNAALKSDALVNGVYTQRFQSEFAEIHGRKYGLMVNSGTDALRIALATLKEVHGWKDTDEIICPATTFVASANIILQNNLRVRFVDVDPFTYNLRPDALRRNLKGNTRGAIIVHLFGNVADMRNLPPIRLIEDSCETMFVRQDGRSVGSFGDIACFSTYMAHIITTGVGGLAITNNKKYSEVMKSYANHGRDPIYLGGNFGRDNIGNTSILSRRFRFDRVGYSSRVTDMEAALGLAQLERWPEIIRKRQYIADCLIYFGYKAKLHNHLQFPVTHIDYSGNARMMFPLVLKRGSLWNLCAHLEKWGIETRPLMPLISQPIYRKMYGNMDSQFPVAAKLTRSGFYIGCHQKMSKEDAEYIVWVLERYFK